VATLSIFLVVQTLDVSRFFLAYSTFGNSLFSPFLGYCVCMSTRC
jgi:hypothetical protein